ncbi:MAG: hypothetical protein ACK5AY_11390 [Bacteroidota bacterium]|jgi:hypothetical protein
MPLEPVDAVNLSLYNEMAKLILHNTANLEAIKERRLIENLALTPEQRMKKAFQLMAMSAKFKNGVLKEPQGKGIVLRRKK